MAKITDLMDDYYDNSVALPAVKVSAKRIQQKTMSKLGRRSRRRVPRLLIAAAVAAVMMVTAGAAYVISHQSTKALMETGPNTGGYFPVELDERSLSVIDDTAQDYGTSVTDNGTTVTLDSVMGFRSEEMSVVYLTLTVAPPADTELTADIQDCGFWEQQTDFFGTSSGTTTAIDNGDGTYSVMLMYTVMGEIESDRMELTLSGFGNVSKEAAHGLYDGTREIEVPGTWSFTIEDLQLTEPENLAFDAALFADAGIQPSKITVSPFGGTVTMADPSEDVVAAHREELKAICPDMDIDWDQMTAEQLNTLLAEGATFTDEQELAIYDLLDYGTGSSFGGINSIQLQYPDGSIYAGQVVHLSTDENGNMIVRYIFEAPQDLDQAEALVIEGTEVPLR